MIEFHRLALVELRQAQGWYREKSQRAAERFLQQIERAIERLQRDPTSYPMIGRDYRSVRISRFPFEIVYRIRAENDVFVIAVAHTARRRSYWRNRK